MTNFNKYFLALGISIFAVASFSLHQAHAAALWGYWPLEINDLTDHSGNGRDMVSNGSGVWPQRSTSTPLITTGSTYSFEETTNNNSAGYFPGSTDCETTGLNWKGTFSVSLWYHGGDGGVEQGLVGGRCGTKGAVQIEFLNDASYHLAAWTSGGAHYLDSGITVDGNTHLVVITGNGTTLKMYVDGSLVDSDTQDTGTSGTNEGTALGASYNGGNQFIGKVDDYAQYTDVMTATEVTTLWNGGNGNPAGGGGGPSGTNNQFALVNFTPSLQGRTLRDFPFYAVQYTVPSDVGTSAPWYVRVQLATTSIITATTTTFYDNSLASVYQSGTHIQNLVKNDLANGTYYYRVSLATSTDSFASWFAQTSGFFNINASSTDFVFNSSSTNPTLVNGIGAINSGVQQRLDALGCAAIPFISNYDAYITSFPFFATSSAARVGCEVKNVVFTGASFLFVPGYAASTTGITVLDGTATLKDEANGLKQVLPFSIYFTITDAVGTGLNAAATSSDLTVKLPGLQPNTDLTYTVLSSTTITDPLTTSFCNTACAVGIRSSWFTWITRGIWGTAGIAALAIIM